jgi:replicative DNA helicase
MNLYSYELEKQFLAGLIRNPDQYGQIAHIISSEDFYDKDTVLNKTLYTILKQALDKNEQIDPVILSQRINELGISFEDDLNIFDYISALSLRSAPKESVESTAREIKKYTVRREVIQAARDAATKMKEMPLESNYAEIIDAADTAFNNRISFFEAGTENYTNLYEIMEDVVEDRGVNPADPGMLGPHPKINKIYGSLVKPGNITVIVARPAVGKTTFALDFVTKVSAKYDAPIIHFDNGEMTEEELLFRQCSALSGVPHYLIESGDWRKSPEAEKKIRDLWPKIKKMKLYYHNVGGSSSDEMVNTLRRFYFSKVGRGNKALFSFDYIKTTFEPFGNKSEWQIVGEMLDKFKCCIKDEITVDGEPILNMFTSIQSNRFGISRNRDSQNVVDDESVVSLSDRVQQFCSHMFILREKTEDELINDGPQFGTHKLIGLKARHLGEDWEGHIRPVQAGDALRRNFINLEFKNFGVKECGDYRDIVRGESLHEEIEEIRFSEDIPSFENL